MKEKFKLKHPIKYMENKQNFVWRSSSLNENLNQIFNNRNAKFHTPNSEISTTEKEIQPLPRNIKLMAQLTLVMSPTSFGIAHSPTVSSLIWIFWVKRALLRWSRSFNPHLLSIAFVVNCIVCTCTGGAFPHRGGAGAAHGDPNLGPKHCDPSDHVAVVVGLSYGPQ